MKKLVLKAASFVFLLVLIILLSGISLKKIVILEEFLLVVCGAVLFTLSFLVQFLKKGKYNAFAGVVSQFAQNALISGVFISLIFILTDINSAVLLSGEGGAVLSKVMLENTRPFLYGAVIWIVLYTRNNKNTDDAESAETVNTPKLSRREMEVARLVSRGLTNLQIADTLYISEATVKRHLATIFQKNGISSRRELQNGREEDNKLN